MSFSSIVYTINSRYPKDKYEIICSRVQFKLKRSKMSCRSCSKISHKFWKDSVPQSVSHYGFTQIAQLRNWNAHSNDLYQEILKFPKPLSKWCLNSELCHNLIDCFLINEIGPLCIYMILMNNNTSRMIGEFFVDSFKICSIAHSNLVLQLKKEGYSVGGVWDCVGRRGEECMGQVMEGIV